MCHTFLSPISLHLRVVEMAIGAVFEELVVATDVKFPAHPTGDLVDTARAATVATEDAHASRRFPPVQLHGREVGKCCDCSPSANLLPRSPEYICRGFGKRW